MDKKYKGPIVGIGLIFVVALLLVAFSLLQDSPQPTVETGVAEERVEELNQSIESIDVSPETSNEDEANGGRQADQEFIAEAFPQLASWQYENLQPYLTSDTVEGMGESDIRQVLGVLAMQFGDLLSFEDLQLMADLTALNLEPNANLHVYDFQANFAREPARVYLAIQADGEQRRIYAFNIQSIGAARN